MLCNANPRNKRKQEIKKMVTKDFEMKDHVRKTQLD